VSCSCTCHVYDIVHDAFTLLTFLSTLYLHLINVIRYRIDGFFTVGRSTKAQAEALELRVKEWDHRYACLLYSLYTTHYTLLQYDCACYKYVMHACRHCIQYMLYPAAVLEWRMWFHLTTCLLLYSTVMVVML
jgi:hypothetical protein